MHAPHYYRHFSKPLMYVSIHMPFLTELNKSTHYNFIIHSTMITDIYMKLQKIVYTLYIKTLYDMGEE